MVGRPSMHGYRLQTATFARYTTEGRLGPPKPLLGDEDVLQTYVQSALRTEGMLHRPRASFAFAEAVKRTSKERSRDPVMLPGIEPNQPVCPPQAFSGMASSGFTNRQPRVLTNANPVRSADPVRRWISGGHSGAQVCSGV